jgi:mevalonate kinase
MGPIDIGHFLSVLVLSNIHRNRIYTQYPNMPAISASAPGKAILFGEHAVVYGRPAIAIPIMEVRAKVIVTANPLGLPGSVRIQSPEVGIDTMLADLPSDHPLAAAVWQVSSALDLPHLPACKIRITSTIPVASGLGSSAAVSVAIIRAFSDFLGVALMDEEISAMAFEIEKLHHGTPSGIDNTVVVYGMPVFFIKGNPPERFSIGKPLTLVIGDSGIASPTALAVADVRKAWQEEPERYEGMFDVIGEIVFQARNAIESGRIETIGMLMNENHNILAQLGVSSPELDHLTTAAREAGAMGAKLCGGGRGGNIIALGTQENAPIISRALEDAGAVQTITTRIEHQHS